MALSRLERPAYVAAVCAATAYTWGTEIGTRWGLNTVSIITGRPVARGANGGVSFQGCLAGAAGSLLVSSTMFIRGQDGKRIAAVACAGLAGSIIDSVAGATVQSTFRCDVCGEMSEGKFHCSESNGGRLENGFRLVTNDTVNWICTGSASLVAWLLV